MANPPFSTLESSDGRFPFDGLRFVTVKSPALGGRADLTLFVPPEVTGLRDVPVVILLHGVYGSHWAWALKGGAHVTTQRLISAGELPPVVLAMPSDGLPGNGSGYLPHIAATDAGTRADILHDALAVAPTPASPPTPDFERWIVEDVPAVVRQAVPETSAQSPLFLAGLSMGGFGALRLGAKHAPRFRAVSGHSSATHADQLKDFFAAGTDARGLAEEDQSVLAAIRRRRAALPPIRFDCGTEDDLLPGNRELHAALEAAGIPHRYEEFPGGHTWGYWERHLVDTLRFFADTLRAS